MDVFDEELLRFWKTAAQYNLKYIMIGGVATNLHGFHRTTEDIDIWIEDTAMNRVALRTVFRECEMGDFESLKNLDFIPGWTYFYLNNGIRLDIMTRIKGFEQETFTECLKYASIATIYETEIPFLHINHLLSAKKAANRPKDQVDIIALEKIKKIQEEEGNQKL